MPLAEGGPHRTASPLGTEPRIVLPWGLLDPITRNTNTQQQPNNTLAACQKSDIYSDLIADKQNLLCFVIVSGTALTKGEETTCLWAHMMQLNKNKEEKVA